LKWPIISLLSSCYLQIVVMVV